MGTIILYVQAIGRKILLIWLSNKLLFKKKRLKEPDEHEVFLGSDSY
jgi:hypothetical protein